MKAEELRIGNLVFDKRNGVVCSVDGLQYSGRIVTEDKKYDDWKRVIDPEGIPLTEEWLIKFGFKWGYGEYKLEITPYADGGRISIYANKHIQLSMCAGEYIDGELPLLSHIEHVHQLQNLIFSLTAEELTIKE
jgi:hypothetical protein